MTINRILITGAAGNLGNAAREHFRGKYPHIRLSDRDDMGPAQEGEEIVQCDLTDSAAVDKMMEGVDAVLQFGGQPNEADWDTILNCNIIGAINTWEAARKAGTKKILFASSNHAIGMHDNQVTIDHKCEPRPDTRYGLSKAFTEDLGRLYAFKHGIASFHMRIGSCFPEPFDKRSLTTWLSYADLCRLLEVGLDNDYLFEIVYGVSNNRDAAKWWDNSNAERMGYKPQDDTEAWRAELENKTYDNPVGDRLHGGMFPANEFSFDLEKLLKT